LNIVARLTGRFRSPGPAGPPSRWPTEPDFWRLWVCGLIMFVVRWIETIAVAVFIYETTSSAFLVAMITMLRMAPLGLCGGILGAMAERVERRTALIWTVVISLSTSLTLAILALSGHLAVWHMAVASFINGAAWAADNPVRRMMMGEVVGQDRVGTSISIDVGANQVSRMAGPTIGGFLLATTGIQGAFILCVGLYVISLVAAFGVRYRKAPETHNFSASLERLIEGFRFAWNDSRLHGTLMVTIIFNLFGWPYTSMVPVVAHDNLHLGPIGVGMLASMEGVGAFMGAIVIGVYAMVPHYGRIYIGGTFLYFVSVICFAVAPEPITAGVSLMGTGWANGCFAIMQTTLIYLLTPADMRARMLGVMVTYIGISLIGFLHIGWLAETVGARWACVATGIEGLIAMALTRHYWWKLLRKDLT
jgi:MFS family permease